MSLTTLCPACGTAFRVHADQLSARGGRVRCGRCTHVFDGVAHLLQEAAAAVREPSPQLGLFAPAVRRSAADPVPRSLRASPVRERSESARVDAVPAAAAEAAPVEVVEARDEPAAPEPEPAGAALAPIFEEAVPVGSAAAPRYLLLWSLLALLCALALAAQVGYKFRTEIAVLWPAARPYLDAACEFADCAISLPRHADLLSIESSDLQTDPQRPNFVVLNALLRNRAQFPQEYPSLELTLTDEADRTVVRKVLSPDDFLDARQSGSARTQGIAGGAEAAIRVRFDSSRVRATGYRLYIFYP